MKKIKKIFNKGKSKKNQELSTFEKDDGRTVSSEKEIISAGEDKEIIIDNSIRNILLIGRSGNGKSTLANVITKTDEFEESSLGVSKTREIQNKKFEEKGIKYNIIDTPGIGDTKLPLEKVLDIIAEAVYLVKDGLNQVFFVSGVRFDQSEMITYDILREIIFDKDITNYTTIIRTRFDKFSSKRDCDTDIKLMIEEAREKKNKLEKDIVVKEDSERHQKTEKLKKELTVTNLAEIIKSCQGRIIHVDNPSKKVDYADELSMNEKKRFKSREKIAEHLIKNCQKEVYKPPKLKDLGTEIVDYMRSKIELKGKLRRLEDKEKKVVNKRDSKTEDNKSNPENVSAESKKKETITRKEEKQADKNLISKVEDNKDDTEIEEEIKKLESRKERIKKEIQVKEKIIRQRVMKHILNNYENINEVPGGNIFVDSIIGDNNNWEDISKEFVDKKLVGEWINCEFNYRQTQEWANALGSNLKPSDFYFYAWLKNSKQLTPEEVLNISIERLKTKYAEQLKKETNILDSHNQQLSQLEDVNITQYFKENFPNWTSGNEAIDKLIQQHQLKATNYAQVLEWIPYDRFVNIEYLSVGGFGEVYKAKWIDGPIEKWNSEKNTWERYPEVVVLKSLSNSSNISTNFLQEVTCNKLVDSDSNIVKLYGISQNSATKNYLMVTRYMEDGNLRKYLQNNYSKLNFEDKLFRLQNIAFGLYSIHKQNLVHRDLHSGNILNDSNYSYISDLGLCKPANEVNDNKVYGVLPYVAPEVLRGQPYTQTSDIYSCSIITYELLTSLPPYYDLTHDESLAMKVCQGLRPKFNIKIPALLEDLIKRCWDMNPKQRPTAGELSKILGDLHNDIDNENSEFAQQVQKAEEFNEKLPDEIKFPKYYINPTATMNSKLINTKEITRLFETKDLISLSINFSLDELNILEEQVESSTQAQIQIPPK